MAKSLKDEIKKQHAFASPAEEAYLNLLKTHGVLTAEVDQLFKGCGISEPQYNVLRILRGAWTMGEFGKRGVPSLEIAERMITRVPDITRLVDRLEGAGLVKRQRCEQDRRVVYVAITEQGMELLKALDEPIQTLGREQLAHMTAAEQRTLSELLVKARNGPPREHVSCDRGTRGTPAVATSGDATQKQKASKASPAMARR